MKIQLKEDKIRQLFEINKEKEDFYTKKIYIYVNFSHHESHGLDYYYY